MARAQNGLSPEELHRHACDDAASSTGPARICRSEVSVAHKEWKGAFFCRKSPSTPTCSKPVRLPKRRSSISRSLPRSRKEKKKQDFESARQDGLHAPCSCMPASATLVFASPRCPSRALLWRGPTRPRADNGHNNQTLLVLRVRPPPESCICGVKLAELSEFGRNPTDCLRTPKRLLSHCHAPVSIRSRRAGNAAMVLAVHVRELLVSPLR